MADKKKELSPEYIEYCKSPRLQQLRTARLKIDNNRCAFCGKPYDLQVHHLIYPRVLGLEDPYRDLITLCKTCHDKWEAEKDEYKVAQEKALQDEIAERTARYQEERRQYEWKLSQVEEFIRENKSSDLSSETGNTDFCNLDVIKAHLYPWLREHGIDDQMGVGKVQTYFRNRRYEKILSMINAGKDYWYIKNHTRFSDNMIRKICNDPEKARAALISEIEEAKRNEQT